LADTISTSLRGSDVNLSTLNSYDEFFICAFCGYCVNNEAACPTFLSQRHEITTARGKLITARNLAQGYLKDKEGLSALTEGLFQCTFCAACEEQCLLDIPLTEVFTELKTLVQDLLPDRAQRTLKDLSQTHNIYGFDQEDRNLWSIDVEEIYEEWVNTPSETGYFIGCVGSYSSKASSAPVSILKLSKLANNPISIFSPTEYCCGNPFLLAGAIEKAKTLATHNVKEIEKLGVKNLIISCAGCYRVFTKVYPELLGKKLPFKVKTHMEYVIELIKSKKLKLVNNKPVKITYKDPCELARHCDVYTVARDLIELLPGVENREMLNNGKEALCCGAGGLVLGNYPSLAEDIAKRLIRQMEDVEAELCLNACPSCQLNISNTLRKLKSPIKAIDITDLVLDRTKTP